MSLSDLRKKQVFQAALFEAKTSYANQLSIVTTDTPSVAREKHRHATSSSIKRISSKIPLSSSEEKILSNIFDNLFYKIQDLQAPPNGKSTPAVGIDLGTTYSCVGYYNFDTKKVVIIQNELGQKLTPSYVAFDSKGQMVIGDPAKMEGGRDNPEDRIYDVKRLIGRTFDDPMVQKDLILWPFKVINEGDCLKIKAMSKTYYPEQISAKILANLKRQAERYLKQSIQNAVITVPAYFNDGQRQATKDAGTIAGLNVLRIINEPTAAALCYSHTVKLPKDVTKNCLIFDLGGGTFDVAIVTMTGDQIQVRAVGGDCHLGGEDFDLAMLDHCLKEFQTKSQQEVNLGQLKNSPDPQIRAKATRCIRRLKNQCEKEKMNLVVAKHVQVVVDEFYGGHDLNVRFKRDLFDKLNMPLFEKCIKIVEEVIQDAHFKKEDIDEVIMVGGSSKIIKIRQMVQSFFDGKTPSMIVSQDEAVAYGAALQAAALNNLGSTTHVPPSISSHDVIPLPIGIKVRAQEGQMKDFSIILDKNTRIPCSAMQSYETAVANQKTITVALYEGVDDLVKNNNLLGSFNLENFPENCPDGEPVNVSLNINEDGILHVTAECPRFGQKSQIVVTAFKKRLQQTDVNEIIMEELFSSLANLEVMV